MNKCVFTVCTADYFQYYIPIFIWSALNAWKDVAVLVYVRGALDDITKAAITQMARMNLHRVNIVENYKTDYPNKISTTNSLRFTTNDIPYDDVLVTDIDFFFSRLRDDPFEWAVRNRESAYFYATHGPSLKPHRPEICPAWTGDFERVAAGFVVLYSDWWHKTDGLRSKYNMLLKTGEMGHYRENDEVILGRIIKRAELPMPRLPLPRYMRWLHLGDFKSTMKHRYTNSKKMRNLTDDSCVNAFLRAKSDPVFSNILDIVCENAQMKEIIGNVSEYCSKRLKGLM
jgi:hypothetical protein